MQYNVTERNDGKKKLKEQRGGQDAGLKSSAMLPQRGSVKNPEELLNRSP